MATGLDHENARNLKRIANALENIAETVEFLTVEDLLEGRMDGSDWQRIVPARIAALLSKAKESPSATSTADAPSV